MYRLCAVISTRMHLAHCNMLNNENGCFLKKKKNQDWFYLNINKYLIVFLKSICNIFSSFNDCQCCQSSRPKHICILYYIYYECIQFIIKLLSFLYFWKLWTKETGQTNVKICCCWWGPVARMRAVYWNWIA